MKLDLHYLFVPKYAKWIIAGLIFLFSVLILLAFSSLIIAPAKITLPPLQTSPAKATQTDSTNYLKDSTLFGVYVAPDLNEQSVKKSMLDVTLVGILLSSDPNNSQVIIRSSSGDEKTYILGDSLPGGALIKRITAGGVLVERNGTLESLSLPKDDLTFEPVPKPLVGE